MAGFFAAGGIGMWPTLAFGLLLLAVGVAHALRPRPQLVRLFAGLGLVTLSCGALGTAMGVVATLMHAGQVESARQYAVRLLGFAESLGNLALALAAIVLATLVLAAGALRAARAAGPEPRDAPP